MMINESVMNWLNATHTSCGGKDGRRGDRVQMEWEQAGMRGTEQITEQTEVRKATSAAWSDKGDALRHMIMADGSE